MIEDFDSVVAECADICEQEADRLEPRAAAGARHCATYIRASRRSSYTFLERLKAAEERAVALEKRIALAKDVAFGYPHNARARGPRPECVCPRCQMLLLLDGGEVG